MSIEGFLIRQRQRNAVLDQLMRDQIARDGGRRISRNLKPYLEEKKAIEAAIAKASTPGLNNGITQVDTTFDGGDEE